MRHILIILFLLISSAIQATTYYVSSGGNTTNSGLTASATWNLDKVNSFAFSAGDNILLKKGDIFYGSITISENGSIGNYITLGSYGVGVNPLVTGFTTVTAWTNLGSNIWESTNAVSTLPTCGMVAVNGVNTAMGRWPNLNDPDGGYVNVDSHVAETSLTCSSLTGTPNWTGAEVVVRTNRWTLSTDIITSQTGNTINYEELGYEPINGFGFFIQNDVRTLDSQNEWYFNPTTKKLRIYSTSQPIDVKVASIDQLVIVTGDYIIVDGLSLSGSNGTNIDGALNSWNGSWSIPSHHTIIRNCNISFTGNNAIYMRGDFVTIENNNISDCNRSSINVARVGDYVIRNNSIQNNFNIKMKAGGTSSAITVASPNSAIVEYNRIVNCGHNGITAGSDSTLIVKNNYIDTFNTLLDDGGGIYSGTNNLYNSKIIGNICLNGIGNWEGTTSTSYSSGSRGIYLDDNSGNFEVSGNTAANCGSYGIFLHNSSYNNIHDNTFYNNYSAQFYVRNNISAVIGLDNTITNNKYVSKDATQYTLSVTSDFGNINLIATSDSNYYARPIDDNLTIAAYPWPSPLINQNLSAWQAYSGQDANSHKSPKAITDVNDLQFYYNDTNSDKIIFVSQPSIDVTGASYVGNVTLDPFSSLVLIEKSAYYVSSTGSDLNDGLTEATAWKTLAKIYATVFQPGDNILLKRGDTWNESLTIWQSGSLGNHITLGAYETGANPTITGFENVTAWTNLGSNIWESTSAVSTLTTCNMVSINGVNTAMGRYPNADLSNGGFLTIASQPTYTSLTCSALTGMPNWSGAEIVIRENDWTFSKRTVTSQTGSTVNYNSDCGAPTNYGFFFQNDIRTLDQQNEWYYNPSTKKISIYSTSQPVNVKVSNVEDIITLGGYLGYVSIDGIDFVGANSRGIFRWVYGTEGEMVHDITIKNCNFSYSGMSAIAVRSNTIIIENCTFNQSNTSAVDLHYSKGVQIKNNIIQNTGLFAGMGVGFSSIEVGGSTDTVLIEYNTIINSGHNPITFGDDVSTIRYNYIDNYDTVLDDGGGIYGGSNATITHNIVLNGVGAWKGSARTSGGTAVGIYLDDASVNNTISNNTVYNASSIGIFLHNASSNTIEDNTSFGNYEQISIKDDGISSALCTNNIIRRNIFITKSATTVVADYYSDNNDLLTNGTILDNNYYARPINDNITFRDYQPAYGNNFKTLAQWKTYSGQDINSKKSPKAISTVNDLVFIYNETSIAKSITLPFVGIDITGKRYVGTSVTLQPYTSLVLIKDVILYHWGNGNKQWKF